jgi:predicted transcriptional regulator
VVDRYGRFLAGGDIRSQGYSSSMLRLIARGYVEGHDGRFTITRLGMSALADRED